MNELVPVTINVTQHDIDVGVRRDCKNCPVARAFNRVCRFPVDVTTTRIQFEDGARLVTSRDMRDFITTFDGYGRDRVKPKKFIVKLSKRFLRRYNKCKSLHKGTIQ